MNVLTQETKVIVGKAKTSTNATQYPMKALKICYEFVKLAMYNYSSTFRRIIYADE